MSVSLQQLIVLLALILLPAINYLLRLRAQGSRRDVELEPNTEPPWEAPPSLPVPRPAPPITRPAPSALPPRSALREPAAPPPTKRAVQPLNPQRRPPQGHASEVLRDRRSLRHAIVLSEALGTPRSLEGCAPFRR